jgi:hypothetical protein
MSATAEEYPVVNYNPAHYIPLNAFKKQWADYKEDGAERVEDPYGQNPHASNFSATLYSCAPFIVLVSMVVILINTMGMRAAQPEAALGAYLSSPTMLFALVCFGVGLGSLYKKARFAVKQKNAVDFALLESVRRYLVQRYGFLPANWEERFISYLVGEDVTENRFSENYELTVKHYRGFNVILVANINGEAPVKN